MPRMTSPSEHIAELRKSYERAELSEDASHADPQQQFDQWLAEAIAGQIPEPNAMTVATVGSDLRPSTRVVLIKGYDARGIVWYTNYESRKGLELAGNPFAALQFHWVELARREDERRGKRRVFRQPPARFAHRRLGQSAKPGHLRPRRAGGQRSALQRAVHAEPAAAAALGGLPAGPGCLAILARPQEPPA